MSRYFHILFASALLLVCFSDIASAQVTFGTGKIYVRGGQYGEIRIFSAEGVDTLQHINRISLIAAGNANQVIDYWNDLDVDVATALVTTPALSDFEISGSYNNSYSGNPPNFLIQQNIYGWKDQSYCIVKCVLTNKETAATPMLAGLDVVQYVDYTWENDHIFYDATNKVLTQFDTHSVGIKILSEPTTSAQVFKWYDKYQDSDPNYYTWLHGGNFAADTLITDADGGVSILGGTETTIEPAATKAFYFAVSVGANNADMLANMALAQQKYSAITAVESNVTDIPSSYVLSQNYPNPFNPSTKISFGLPAGGNAVLKVFNSLGEEVAEVVNGYLEAGTHTVNFDASNLPSGLYIYSLQADGKTLSKKMTLLK